MTPDAALDALTNMASHGVSEGFYELAELSEARAVLVAALAGDGDDYTIGLALPAGTVPQHGVLVVAYFDAEGTTKYGFRVSGEASLANVLGLLDLVKFHVVAGAQEEA